MVRRLALPLQFAALLVALVPGLTRAQAPADAQGEPLPAGTRIAIFQL